jgi:hypothetical protein
MINRAVIFKLYNTYIILYHITLPAHVAYIYMNQNMIVRYQCIMIQLILEWNVYMCDTEQYGPKQREID